jgi:hypothetical protein
MVFALAMARPAAAQSGAPQKVFHGLFGPAENEQVRPRQLDVIWSLYGAQDDNSFVAGDGDILDAALQASRPYSGAGISLAYTRRPPRKLLTITASSAARYYPDLHRIVSTRYGGTVAYEFLPSQRWRVQTAGTASYSPFYQVVLGAPSQSGPDVSAPTTDYAASRQDSMTYGSSLSAKRTFSPTSSLTMSYGMRYTQFLDAAQYADQRAGFQYTRALSKSFALNLGYGFSASAPVRGSAEPGIHSSNIDVGIGYGRTLFRSARTSLAIATGSSTVSSGANQQFLVTGSARLSHEVSRLWTTQLVYDRGVQVPAGALRPFFSDTVTGSLTGFVNRRVLFRVFPSYAHGTVGLGDQSNAYYSLSTTARLEGALTHELALYVEQFYYQYRFATTGGLPATLAGGLNRKGVRAGLTLWTPAIR